MEVSVSFSGQLRYFLVLEQVLSEFGMVLEGQFGDGLDTLIALGKGVVVVFLVLVLLPFEFLLLASVSAPLTFPVEVVEVALHGLHHLADLISVFTEEFVFLYLVLGDKVQSIVPALVEEVLNLLPILAAVEVEDELLLGEGVVSVEGAAGQFVVLPLFEHTQLLYFKLPSSPFTLFQLPAYRNRIVALSLPMQHRHQTPLS